MRKFLFISLLTTIALVSFVMNDNDNLTNADQNIVVIQDFDPTCNSCKNDLETALNNILGVKEYSVDPEKEILKIKFDPRIMEPEWIVKALNANGYEAEL